MSRKTVFVVALLLLAGTRSALAQSVRVVPDRTSIALGDTLTVRISIQGKFDSTSGPDLADFDVVGKSQGSSVSVINGQVQQEVQVTLSLAPKRPGNLSIGAIELQAGGRTVASSKPVLIRVSGQGAPPPAAPGASPGAPSAAPPAGEVPGGAADSDAGGPSVPDRYAGQQYFLLARVPERPVYAGEPVWIQYELYTHVRLPVSDAQVEGQPDFKAFVVQQPGGRNPEGRRVTIKGVPYNLNVVWRGAVTALGAGRAVLPGIGLTLFVSDGFFTQRRRVASEPVALDFRPVPPAGRPADWVEGTVGRFVLKASLDRMAVGVGENAVLTVEVSGAGNLQAVRAPSIQTPDGLRVSAVPSKDLDEVVVDVGGVSGRRAFQFLLTPERAGDFEIGRVDLSFFNPLTGKYERSRSEPLKLVAAGGRGTGPVREVRRRGEPVVGFVASSDLAEPPAPGPRTLPASAFYAGIALPLVVLLFVETTARRRAWRERNGVSIARRRALKDALARLAALDRSGPPGPEFWAGLDGAIRDFLSVRFGLPVAGLTNEELCRALQAAGAGTGAIEALLAELENCAFGRFAPSAAQDRDRRGSLERVRDGLSALDRSKGGA